MPLLDLFHPPLSDTWDWEGVHSAWANAMVQQLGRDLPPGYFSQPQIKLGRQQIEVDVSAWERSSIAGHVNGQGGVATATWAPPQPKLSVEVDFHDLDVFEIQVFKKEGGAKLVAAIELASPANKDRPNHRLAFVTKCASLLQRGVAIIMVDVVTERTANLHSLLMELLRLSAAPELVGNLYAVAYRVVGVSAETGRMDVWPENLQVGKAMPDMPLWLAPDLVVPVELESAYRVACSALRIPMPV